MLPRYDYIRDHLGYRLEVTSVTFPPVLNLSSPHDFSCNFSLINWGFAAPINPRPVLLVLLAADSSAIRWRSAASLADVRDWQPSLPGDPTFSPLLHQFGSSSMLSAADVGCVKGQPENCTYMLGLYLPDARMDRVNVTAAAAAAFSVRLANDDTEWVMIPGAGAVNVFGNLTVLV